MSHDLSLHLRIDCHFCSYSLAILTTELHILNRQYQSYEIMIKSVIIWKYMQHAGTNEKHEMKSLPKISTLCKENQA